MQDENGSRSGSGCALGGFDGRDPEDQTVKAEKSIKACTTKSHRQQRQPVTSPTSDAGEKMHGPLR